jgi:hypothetical protein
MGWCQYRVFHHPRSRCQPHVGRAWPRSVRITATGHHRPSAPQIQALSSWSRFSCGGGGLIMQHGWPGPVAPGQRRGTIRLIRCARCGGPLYHTKTKGQPRQEDHEQGCEAFIRAIRAMRYVDELKRSASESAVAWGRTWRRRYLRENAKKLSVAACESDPVAAISALGDLYQAECQARGKRPKSPEKTEIAETLMRACRRLALGQDPGPITPRPS